MELSTEDKERIEQWIEDNYHNDGPYIKSILKISAEYEHNYQREQQAKQHDIELKIVDTYSDLSLCVEVKGDIHDLSVAKFYGYSKEKAMSNAELFVRAPSIINDLDTAVTDWHNKFQNECTEKLKLEAERSELRNKVIELQRYHQTLIARYYNGSPETKPILNTIIDEIDKMLIKWNSPKEV